MIGPSSIHGGGRDVSGAVRPGAARAFAAAGCARGGVWEPVPSWGPGGGGPRWGTSWGAGGGGPRGGGGVTFGDPIHSMAAAMEPFPFATPFLPFPAPFTNCVPSGEF